VRRPRSRGNLQRSTGLPLAHLPRPNDYPVHERITVYPLKKLGELLEALQLDHLWLIYPGANDYPVHERITVYPLKNLGDLPEALDARGGQKVTSAEVQ